MNEIIETKYGKISGIKKDGCFCFLGIPFAKPPVKELAFKHPVECDVWQGVMDCSKAKRNPVQEADRNCGNYFDQDCLYMNVYVPEGGAEQKAVMVWIYGGSYTEGGTGLEYEGKDKILYDMCCFARETDTVVVTFNYRLNIYGFLNLHYLNDRFDQNCGLMDQVLALKYVRENIDAFGGDSSNVTVFGQSAGAACILALMTMEQCRDGQLFDKAIAMSPCIDHFFSEEESRKNTKDFLKLAGCDAEGLLNLTVERAGELAEIFAKNMRYKKMEMRCAFSPVVDGKVLKEFPSTGAVKSSIPLLIGTVAEEANIFTLPVPAVALLLMGLKLGLKPQKKQQGIKRDFKHRFADSASKLIYFDPVEKFSNAYSGSLAEYKYSWVSAENKKNGLGCYHFSEIPVLFGWRNNDEESRNVSRVLTNLMKQFAWNGMNAIETKESEWLKVWRKKMSVSCNR